MKEKIIEFIKTNEFSDAIDISIGTKIFISHVYTILNELQDEKIITKQYSGIQTYYTVN